MKTSQSRVQVGLVVLVALAGTALGRSRGASPVPGF